MALTHIPAPIQPFVFWHINTLTLAVLPVPGCWGRKQCKLTKLPAVLILSSSIMYCSVLQRFSLRLYLGNPRYSPMKRIAPGRGGASCVVVACSATGIQKHPADDFSLKVCRRDANISGYLEELKTHLYSP